MRVSALVSQPPRSSPRMSATGPGCVSLSGFTTELTLWIRPRARPGTSVRATTQGNGL